MMELDEYRKGNLYEVETDSGMVFKLRDLPIEAYDDLMEFFDKHNIDPENPDTSVVRKFPGELATILIPPASVEPEIKESKEDVEDPDSQLGISEVSPPDLLRLMREIMERMGSLGEKAEDMESFRGEQSTGE